MDDRDVEEKLDRLNANLEELSEKFGDAYSLRRVFARGVLTGIGTVIGASIIAAILLTILFQFFGFLGIRSAIERLLSPDIPTLEESL